MSVEIISRLYGRKLNMWNDFVKRAGLEPDGALDRTVLVWEGESIIATGSREGNILKLLAIDPSHRGEDLSATVITALRQDAFEAGHRHLFLYTKPENERIFSSLFFYTVAKTDKVLLMENKKDGISDFLDTLTVESAKGVIGSAVMNCNPFTLGHKKLIELASSECDRVYVFVLSEDKSRFSSKDRMEMVRLGTKHLSNVTVLLTGPYLISSATFPTYFLKDRDRATEIQCNLDIEIFARHFAPKFSINRRYVGTEPFSPLTERYNEALKKNLSLHGIELRELSRYECEGVPVSASAVRELIDKGQFSELEKLLPETTLMYLKENNLI